jgi:hypothetical protein
MRWTWLATLPTTNARIFCSLLMAVATAAVYLGGVVLEKRWEPSVEWLGFLCLWAGLDVLQFAGKRFSDAGYQASKRASGAQETPNAQ